MTVLISTLWLISAAFLAILGCGYLALSQSKHCKSVTSCSDNPTFRKTVRAVGWFLLTVSFIFCVLRDGWGFAVLLWALIVAGGAITISLLLAYRPSCLGSLVVEMSVKKKKLPPDAS